MDGEITTMSMGSPSDRESEPRRDGKIYHCVHAFGDRQRDSAYARARMRDCICRSQKSSWTMPESTSPTKETTTDEERKKMARDAQLRAKRSSLPLMPSEKRVAWPSSTTSMQCFKTAYALSMASCEPSRLVRVGTPSLLVR